MLKGIMATIRLKKPVIGILQTFSFLIFFFVNVFVTRQVNLKILDIDKQLKVCSYVWLLLVIPCLFKYHASRGEVVWYTLDNWFV